MSSLFNNLAVWLIKKLRNGFPHLECLFKFKCLSVFIFSFASELLELKNTLSALSGADSDFTETTRVKNKKVRLVDFKYISLFEKQKKENYFFRQTILTICELSKFVVTRVKKTKFILSLRHIVVGLRTVNLHWCRK